MRLLAEMLERSRAQHLQRKLEEITGCLKQHGIAEPQRVVQLRAFLRACVEDSPSNSVHDQFGPEYFVYAFEYVDFAWEHLLQGKAIDLNTLRRIFSGGFEFNREKLESDDSRNLLLQVRTATYLAQGGFRSGVTESSDVFAIGEKNAYVVECKRIYSFAKRIQRAREAAAQINKGISSAFGKGPMPHPKGLGGIVWLDLTPLFLEFRTLVPAADQSIARLYNTLSIRSIVAPVATALDDAQFSSVKFLVAQGSAMFWNMGSGQLEYRIATYARPTRHSSWGERRRFGRSMSYLQNYRRGDE